MVYFVESLTVRTWWCAMVPRLLARRLRRSPVKGCLVIEHSPAALRLANAMRPLTGVAVEVLQFRLIELRDDQGLLLRLRVASQDIVGVQEGILTEPVFQAAVKMATPATKRLPTFLAKAISTIGFTERGTLWRTLLTIHVCVRALRQRGLAESTAMVLLERQPWLKAIRRYAARYRLDIRAVSPPFNLERWLRRHLPAWVKLLLRDAKRWWYVRKQRSAPAPRPSASVTAPPAPTEARRPRIAVEYTGHLNLDNPARHSDLFFWQQSSLSGEDMLVTFKLAADPFDRAKLAELAAHGMRALVLDPAATTVPEAPFFRHEPRARQRQRVLRGGGIEGRWLRAQLAEYDAARDYWEDLFATHGIKIFLTWFKYDGWHCAIGDAMEALGGITAVYQRAYESHPLLETTIHADLVFGFSRAGVELERCTQSVIPYYVMTGYLGDHRVPLLREEAKRVRELLLGRGAQRIIAFTDESSRDDARWHTGHQFQRDNYMFLLEKVLAEPWFGLVVKPKCSANLRQRLGPVAELLAKAEATGRCFVYEGGALQVPYPPAVAAMAADVMVHGHLAAGTAGLESALAGVPTLLLDREGWSVSPLYRLGIGRVAFTDWESLWKACLEHWGRAGGVPQFGDWSLMLDELDPFRDGRAAERMGTYLQWLLEGFKAGLSRETVLADAAERYASRWGREHIVQIGGGTVRPLASREAEPATAGREALVSGLEP